MKTLVITGGSSGIGLAAVILFAERGWQVFSLSRHKADIPAGLPVTHIDCDVTDSVSVNRAVSRVLELAPHIDVVVSNAGFGISGPVEFTSLEDAQRQFDVNFFGAVRFVQAVLPALRKQQSGTIIFTSSVAAQLSVPYQSFYSASKAAVNALALALANEVRTFGIHVSCLMPGDVATGFTAARDKSVCGGDVYLRAWQAVEAMEKDERNGMKPEQMARILWTIANKRNPAPFYVGGGVYRLLCFPDRLLPKRFVNWIEWRLYC
jgi:NAD(P)-dependent dehydrogenase (short-subunit alcohol dehydrogenase family)